jgi:uncharacterized repeat protein (TIGR03803 family)
MAGICVRHNLIPLIALTLLAIDVHASPKFEVLHAFDPSKGDGSGLYGSVAIDVSGKLYGMTAGGGTYGYGTIFELTPTRGGDWSETILRNLGGNDNYGDIPNSGMVVDGEGNLYGMTTGAGPSGFGTVLQLRHDRAGWVIDVIHDRGGHAAGPLLDNSGNVYGPMDGKGKYDRGAISELVRSDGWKGRWVYSFCARKNQKGICLDGYGPFAGLTWGQGNTLYGTTLYGGDSPYCQNPDCGTVYELIPEKDGSWKETVLHSFPATENDGSVLYAGVALDKSGNVYGATSQGGSTNCGVIFKLSRKANGSWAETILHDYTNQADGCNANTMTFDKHGNLWGTAQGGTGCKDGGCGVVFEMTPGAKGKWSYTMVHSFDGIDGDVPAAAVIFDKHGNLYGTTELGGCGSCLGVVFEVTP